MPETPPCRVLYMEDDAAQARLVQKCLEREGYSVDVALDGLAGLGCYGEKPYQVVVVDQTMPLLSGLEVIRGMLARGPLPPTIMVTGTGSEQMAVEAMKLGVSDYLVKDLQGGFIRLLPLTIGRALAQQRLLEEKQQAERDRKRMEQELFQAQKLESIGQLAAGIAHEINTPIQYIGDNHHFLQDAFADLAAMMSLCDRLLEAAKQSKIAEDLVRQLESKRNAIELDYLTQEIPKAIRQSLEGVERVASIVGAMKEFSHPGCQEKQAVDLNHAIQSTLTISRNEWKYVADVNTDLDPLLPTVHCLPTEINQVVLNVVVNAAHAVADALKARQQTRGTISVRTRRDGSWAEIRVEDTGTGIPEAVQSRIFDPFFTTKEVGQGSGQGLAIARSIIVDRHGGTIRFETAAGEGTTFIIRLPIEGRPSPEASTPAASVAASS